MSQIWNGDWSPGNKSQYGDVEYSGTFDGTPSVGQRVIVGQTHDGYPSRDGNPFAKIVVAAGDQYGSSSGERTLLRQFPGSSIVSRAEGWDSAFAMSLLFPTNWPFASDLDIWACWEWHGSSPHPSFTNIQPAANALYAGCNGQTGSVNRDEHVIIDNLQQKLGVWHDLIVRVKHHSTAGIMEVWHRQPNLGGEFVRKLNLTNRPTIFTGVKNYLLLGLYGPARGYTRSIYHDAAREYSTVDEAMNYMKTLSSAGTPTTPEPEPVPVPPDPVPQPTPDLMVRVEELEAEFAKLEAALKTASKPKSTFGSALRSSMGW